MVLLQKGLVDFIGAQINSSFICINGKFENANIGDALNCNGARIENNVFLTDGFNAKGKVDFDSVQIGGSLVCANGTFENTHGWSALSCNRAKIEGSVYLEYGFTAKGIVGFVGTNVGSSLICRDAEIDGSINLDSAKAKDLIDNEKFWNYKGLKSISLDGFVYEHIRSDFQAEKRREWLSKMPEFKPQPYKQLAKVLRDMGHIKDSNKIMIEKRDNEVKRMIGVFKYLWLFFGTFAGYGYNYKKLFAGVFIIWFSFGLLYLAAANCGIFAPTNPIIFEMSKDYNVTTEAQTIKHPPIFVADASRNWYFSALKGEYSTFEPFIYSLDVLIPLLDLHMEKDWGVYIPSPKTYYEPFDIYSITWNHIVRLLIIIEVTIGWFLGLLIVPAFSEAVKKITD